MKKVLLVAPVLVALTGCGSSEHDRQVQAQQQIQAQQQQIIAQQQQLQAQQAEYQQQYTPPVQQYAPQVIPQQQYAQPPVIVHQTESSSGVGSFVAGAAAGALAGHVYNKMNEQPVAPTHDTHYSSNSLPAARNTPPMPTVAPPLPEKKNYMDTAKFASTPPVNLAKPAPIISKPVPAAKPSFMNMSKLSKK
jgi:hypothetical protein